MRTQGCVLVIQSCPVLCAPWAVALQAPLSMGFFRQEYWSGLPRPTPRDCPKQNNYLQFKIKCYVND